MPVFNSVAVVGQTIDRITEVFERAGLRYQLVLVNDGSKDGSWEVIAERARTSPHVVALNLLRNYGQHHANLAGLREATGDYVITMDDDLQNPPDQALLLIEKALTGHDVVFGRFERKQAPGYRRLGSTMISLLNRRVFAQPPGLAVSNFRILRRDVVDRICASRTAHPYITGQALMYSHSPADVLVRHDAASGRHQQLRHAPHHCRWCSRSCSATRCSRCAAAALVGFVVAFGSFLLGGFYLVRSLFVETAGARLDDDRGAALGPQRRGHHAALDAGRVRRTHAERGQRAEHLPRDRAGLLVSRHLLVIGAQRCGTTYLHSLLDAHPDITMARPARPEPKVFCDDDASAKGAAVVPRRPGSPTPTTEQLLGDKSTSYLEDPEAPARAATMLGERTRGRGAARPGRSARSRTGGSAPSNGLEDTAAGDRAAREPRAAGGVGPDGHLGVPVRLPRARPLPRPPRARGSPHSRTRFTCVFLRELLADEADARAALGRLWGWTRAWGRRRREEAVNRSEEEAPALSSDATGNTGGVLRGERPCLGCPPRAAAALVTDAWRGRSDP